ncbi:MAG TPA: carboxylating nicotinate-nucleotide diphosphorylase [Gemmatimonadales bacterium]
MSTKTVPERLPDLAADAERVALLALAEDGPRDLTSEVCLEVDRLAAARIEFRGQGVLAGVAYADAVARLCGCTVAWLAEEGEPVQDRAVGRLGIGLAGILLAERPLLNVLQRASGIATLTRACVDAVAGTGCGVLHTRKTAPGLRLFDAAAVVAGGGQVHRLDLAHTVLIKDNHWRVLRETGRSLAEALETARGLGALECQVEVESLEQLEEACAAGADRLLLDNQRPRMVRHWAERARALRADIAIEATGGITLSDIRGFAEAGADFVSLGALTHSVLAANLSITLETI